MFDLPSNVQDLKTDAALSHILSSVPSTQALAMPPLPVPLFLTLLQLAVLTCVSGGAYYGHKQHPQPYQPMQHLQHMGKEGFPQQQYLGKEVPYMQYPHYRKELPQMPMHKGKENARKGGGYNGGQDKGEKVNISNKQKTRTYIQILNVTMLRHDMGTNAS